MHPLTAELLLESYRGLKKDAAAGVDEMTWRAYEDGLTARVLDLHKRVQSGRYRAKPSKRIYLPKPDGKLRPIGIASLEDKIVQAAVVRVLEQIDEEDFLGFSYGYRPRRSQHHALDAVWVGINSRKINWILDADLKSFFDSINPMWMLRFLEHRIADRRILRLIRKGLRAGISEDGQGSRLEKGTPQGSVITPQTMLQNAPFRGLSEREAVNPVDHFSRFVADFNLFHQGSYHLSFCRPVRLIETAIKPLGKGLDLTHHQLKILQTILFC